ncbi:hypothetical protein QBC35DRAFT_454015 [Podospora australis]|uniref:Uncharacterized protein n=1 Tax=Podospora australis TaxID=1536484 RepID=A0AAN7AHA4_9PEZI|nr:hypothetical protein QBC35DRAFT_454015 [Podospora australis]
MCFIPIIKYACCDLQYVPTPPPPVVRFCPEGHCDDLSNPYPTCPLRTPIDFGEIYHFPIKCPTHKREWLAHVDLHDECQKMDTELREAGVSDELLDRYRRKMGRVFETITTLTNRMETQMVAAWEATVFCAGQTLAIMGRSLVGAQSPASGNSNSLFVRYQHLEALRRQMVDQVTMQANRLKPGSAVGSLGSVTGSALSPASASSQLSSTGTISPTQTFQGSNNYPFGGWEQQQQRQQQQPTRQGSMSTSSTHNQSSFSPVHRQISHTSPQQSRFAPPFSPLQHQHQRSGLSHPPQRHNTLREGSAGQLTMAADELARLFDSSELSTAKTRTTQTETSSVDNTSQVSCRGGGVDADVDHDTDEVED